MAPFLTTPPPVSRLPALPVHPEEPVLDPLAELVAAEDAAAAAAGAPHRPIVVCARCGQGRLLHAGVRGEGPSLVPSTPCPGFQEPTDG